MKTGCNRATAMAAASATVVHVGLGNFISQYDICEYNPEDRPSSGIPVFRGTQVSIVGRTDKGERLAVECSVVQRGLGSYMPVEKVMIAIVNVRNPSTRYFECLITEAGIKIRELEKSWF